MGIYNKLFDDLGNGLKATVINCESLLDLGCGVDSQIKFFNQNLFSIGVDIDQKVMSKSQIKKIHNQYFQMNVLEAAQKFGPKSFDCVWAIDLIEHLNKEDGYRLIKDMEMVAKKRIVIFTPNGFLAQDDYDGNPWQIHKSGWFAEEFLRLGYKVQGINGLKYLRTSLARIRFRPNFFWLFLSHLSQFYTKKNPNLAFQLLCIKNL